MKNNLEEVWREEFESLFNEKYNKTLCGYTLKQWTTQERMDQEREFAFPYYVEARKKAQEDIEFWKNEYVSHSETMCRCQEELQKTRERHEKCMISFGIKLTEVQDKHDELLNELQKTREQLSKAEQRIFHLGECSSLWEYQGICDCGYEQYFKDKQGE